MSDEQNLSRRGILRLGSIAGGLLLPFAGGQALSLVDRKSAADLAVKRQAFSMSPQMAQFWGAAEELACSGKPFYTGDDLRGGALSTYDTDMLVRKALRQKMEDAAAALWAQPCVSWRDVAERAEIAWTAAPKEQTWSPVEAGLYEPQRFTGRLLHGQRDPRTPSHTNEFWAWGEFPVNASAALIEGVLSMTHGRRFSPCIEGDRRATAANGYEWRPLEDPTASSLPWGGADA